ncbi:CDP-alcohol phosphatidyltransferase family protein [Halomonas urumqiensis]|uniref:CDP-alcohol phosphatidyltransferase n=1 Tax=Halomonas urumqiensis TaxID=1684789 RepID=A0A2N7UDA2_9GAMM|nr:CDP-alcohol phosphatidyltransferase family protein [Halomonas urumqiensis]PMR78432.1 CDP-alcohol phosphatidyltransferase [Halomonas urumqiensis]PTB03577.1 CDP-alcohol phosphatidyltransferase [Halomonas urumqiensis]GHE20221.1 membrane protein [Halomonas urumqiensis]
MHNPIKRTSAVPHAAQQPEGRGHASGRARSTRPGWLTFGELLAGLVGLGLLLALLDSALAFTFDTWLVAIGVYLGMASLLWRGMTLRPAHFAGLGAANRVTLARGVLVALLAGALVDPARLAVHGSWLAGLALLSLALDGVDGWVARQTDSASELGARFDMELDAAFIMVLCLALLVAGKVGAWILAIGAMRYLFVLAGLWLEWMNAPLPDSFRRKAVCVWQVAALLLALLPMVESTLASGLAATALAGLVASFAIDVHWLYRQRDVAGE